jgi:hypothetical protein
VRRGAIESAEGARLTYILNAGASTCRGKLEQKRLDEQQEQIRQLTAQLAALQSGVPVQPIPAAAPEAQEPAWAREPQPPALPAPVESGAA